MWNYGNLCKKIFVIFWVMMIGMLVIIGVGILLIYYGFVGFLLKDVIIESVWVLGNGFVFWVLVVVVLFISFYLWCLMFLIFWGEECGDYYVYEYVYESLLVMLIFLGVLVFGVIFVGMIWLKLFFGDYDKMVKFFGMLYYVEMFVEGYGDDYDVDDYGDVFYGDDYVMVDKDYGVECGVIYMLVEFEVILDEVYYVLKWVKISLFLVMLIGLVIVWVMYICKLEWFVKLVEN